MHFNPIKLASLALQSELGGFDPDVHNLFFLSEFRFIPKQDEEFEVAVLEAYKNLDKNMTPADAEKRYLEVNNGDISPDQLNTFSGSDVS